MMMWVGTSKLTKVCGRVRDPLSPLLFNLVADMLVVLISRVKEDGQITGLVSHLVDGGLSILQYADDTILFMEHDFKHAKKHEAFTLYF
jgi:hypothetical protein